ncbi:MAG: hypothetical protein E7183_04320 [Erysipelotrichaceae bacterium]|nr:hypothetical protein [Erysipelotrichaceae bacterium]
MFFLKNKYIKKIVVFILFFISIILLNVSISATTNPYIEITDVTTNVTNNTVTFKIDNYLNTNTLKYGIIISNVDCDVSLKDETLVKYEIKGNLKKTSLITLSVPEEYNYYNMYVRSFVVTENEVIYSNKVKYIYAELAGLSEIIIKDVSYDNGLLSFKAATFINNNAEYGLIFSKNKLFTKLNLENAENDQIETEITKLEVLNENNEFRVNIKDIPIYHLDVTFKACLYVKEHDTNNVYYTETISINLLDLYYNEIINNMDISYSAEYDGIRFKTSTILPNKNNYILGFVFLNKKTNVLDINTPNVFIQEAQKEDSFAVTMNNIPISFQDKDIYAVAFLKFINENLEYEYYYSDIYNASYNEVKETYLTNNS